MQNPRSDFPRAVRHALTVVGAIAVACSVALGMNWVLDEDLRRAYPWPEVLEDVHLVVPAGPAETEPTRDFDGDGVEDALSNERWHMEPRDRPATNGLVRVVSGRTGEVLMARAVSPPILGCSWFGDADGNGTCDVLIDDAGDAYVLGYRPRR